MVPKGSQVQCVLHQLFMRALPGAVRPSRSQHLLVVGLLHDFPHVHLRFHWSIQLALVPITFLWVDPAFQLAVGSNPVLHLSSFFVSQDTTTCRERGASIVPFGTKLAHIS